MNKDELHNEIIEDYGPETNNDVLPPFLNVLTILTFIGSGLAAIMALYNLTTVEQQKRDMAQLSNLSEVEMLGDNFYANAQAMIDNIYMLQGTAIVAAILCILGAYLMRQRKKTGFLLYLVASIASILIPFTVVGFDEMNFIFLIGMLFGALITIVFVIMYSVNYKYLR